MSRDWESVAGYEVDAGSWGVSISNYQDDSSGATTLTVEEAFTLLRVLAEAATYALERKIEVRKADA